MSRRIAEECDNKSDWTFAGTNAPAAADPSRNRRHGGPQLLRSLIRRGNGISPVSFRLIGCALTVERNVAAGTKLIADRQRPHILCQATSLAPVFAIILRMTVARSAGQPQPMLLFSMTSQLVTVRLNPA